MQIAFTKLNGAGNDFILIDNRDRRLSLKPDTVAQLCHRQNGIGADGLILQEKAPDNSGTDWQWQFFNSDGSSAEMCGNGARCFARFVTANKSETRSSFTVSTLAGTIRASVNDDAISVGLTEPTDPEYDFEIRLEDATYPADFINTGVPHAVLFPGESLDDTTVQNLGRRIRFHSKFAPKGTNVNFAKVIAPGHVSLRTYERGVEAETLACGTGVSATALIAARKFNWPSPVKVDVRNGDTLEVGFTRDGDKFSDVTLTGPATIVFSGTVEIED